MSAGAAALTAVVSLSLAPCAVAADLRGIVSRVQDGDTLTVQTPSGSVTVRLEGIDAPELAQPYGPESRDTLATLCPTGSAADIKVTGRDRFARTLGWVTCGPWAANVLQVESGSAWAFGRYLSADSPLFELQRTAQNARRGLWSDPAPEAPWDYRARIRR